MYFDGYKNIIILNLSNSDASTRIYPYQAHTCQTIRVS